MEVAEGKWFIASAHRPVPSNVVEMVRSMGGDTEALGNFRGTVKVRKEVQKEGEYENPVYALNYKLNAGEPQQPLPEGAKPEFIEFKGIGLVVDDRMLVARGPGKTHALMRLAAGAEGQFVGSWVQPGKGLGLCVWQGRQGGQGLAGHWPSVTLFEQKKLEKVEKERKKEQKKGKVAVTKPPKVQWSGSAEVVPSQSQPGLYQIRFFEMNAAPPIADDAAVALPSAGTDPMPYWSHVGTAIEYGPGLFAVYYAKVRSKVVVVEGQPQHVLADSDDDNDEDDEHNSDHDDDHQDDGKKKKKKDKDNKKDAPAVPVETQVVRSPEEQDISVYQLAAPDGSAMSAQLATFGVDGFGSEHLVRAVARQLAHFPKMLVLDIVKARGLHNKAHLGGVSDPFVAVRLLNADGTESHSEKGKWQTKVLADNLNPAWNESIEIKLSELAAAAGKTRTTLFEGTVGVRVIVLDKKMLRKDKSMGHIDLMWQDLDAAARVSAPLFYTLAGEHHHHHHQQQQGEGEGAAVAAASEQQQPPQPTQHQAPGELKLRVRFVGVDKLKLDKKDKDSKKKDKKK